MSASLVGSEMCIRDRRFLGRRDRSRSAASAPSLFRASGHTSRHHGRAVSYTHLTLPTICSV
eukprot:12006926-Alexandrium_andersonii.AAC.1